MERTYGMKLGKELMVCSINVTSGYGYYTADLPEQPRRAIGSSQTMCQHGKIPSQVSCYEHVK